MNTEETDWTAIYNALPLEVRKISSAMETKTRIQHLLMEKRRLKRRYQQSCAELNDYIKSCEQTLIRYSRERKQPPTDAI